jgi:hypothetical protein
MTRTKVARIRATITRGIPSVSRAEEAVGEAAEEAVEECQKRRLNGIA